jgi:hypothetical protein
MTATTRHISDFVLHKWQQQHVIHQTLSCRNDSNNTSYIRLCPAEMTATNQKWFPGFEISTFV